MDSGETKPPRVRSWKTVAVAAIAGAVAVALGYLGFNPLEVIR